MGIISVFIVLLLIVFSEAAENEIEGRGKKKKIALFIFLADLVIKKIFILKLVYAFVLWVILHKAGYFFSWFLTYLKQQKHSHSYHDHDHDHHPDHHYDYGPPDYYKRKSENSYNPYSKPISPNIPYRTLNPY